MHRKQRNIKIFKSNSLSQKPKIEIVKRAVKSVVMGNYSLEFIEKLLKLLVVALHSMKPTKFQGKQ